MIFAYTQTNQQHEYQSLYSKGSSNEAVQITKVAQEAFDRLRESNTFGWPAAELEKTFKETNSPNWDGYGALPVSQLSYHYANKILKALPFGTETPTFCADPDGQLTMEWYRSPNKILSISIDPTSQIHYAAILGPASRYGSEPFFDAIPEPILDLIDKITSANQ